jgi:filamentous hemagglutinin
MRVYRTPAALNKLGSQRAKEVLRHGTMTKGVSGRYPNGWTTFTLQNGNAASWNLDGSFIGFRGL